MAEGRPLLKQYTMEEIIHALYECGGKLKDTAKYLHVGLRTIYDHIDIYPELAEAKAKAEKMFDHVVNETCYDKLDEILENPDDQAIALKALTVALTKSKLSRYYTAPTNALPPGSTTNLTELAEISQELAAANKEIARYKAQLIE